MGVVYLVVEKTPPSITVERTIQKAHANTVPTTQTLLDHCWNVWHLERKKRQLSQSSGSPVSMAPGPKAVKAEYNALPVLIRSP